MKIIESFPKNIEELLKQVDLRPFEAMAEYHESLDWLVVIFRDCSICQVWSCDSTVAILLDNHPKEGQSPFVGFLVNGILGHGITVNDLRSMSISDTMYEVIKANPMIIKNIFQLLEEHGFKYYK